MLFAVAATTVAAAAAAQTGVFTGTKIALLGRVLATLGVGFLPDEITVRVIANQIVPLTGSLLATLLLLLVRNVAATDALDHVVDQQGEMPDGTAGRGSVQLKCCPI